MKILIVEDDNVLALMLERMISKMGYQIAAVTSSGNKAVELAREKNCDLILMDIMLEDDLDGIDAYKQIHKKSKTPVIYITGNSDPMNVERAREIGYHDYIIKPVIFEDLRSSIKKLEEKR